MGLDLVELVMEVEEAFDIELPDDRVSQMLTVGDLYDYIVESKRDTVSSRKCLSAATFYMIRRAVAAETGVAPRQIQPRTSVHETLPVTGRRALWARLQKRLGLTLPTLCRPSWLVGISTVLVAATALAVLLLAIQKWGSSLAVWIGILTVVTAGFLANVLTMPWATIPRAHFTTFREFSSVVLAQTSRNSARSLLRGMRRTCSMHCESLSLSNSV